MMMGSIFASTGGAGESPSSTKEENPANTVVMGSRSALHGHRIQSDRYFQDVEDDVKKYVPGIEGIAPRHPPQVVYQYRRTACRNAGYYWAIEELKKAVFVRISNAGEGKPRARYLKSPKRRTTADSEALKE